ncbi:hypothetical protein Y032_0094g2709 [Ancylostoma ceylanicum]|nr:hypothetical protein Y032_0094g2709 [Ancylostoma ceylanicum]
MADLLSSTPSAPRQKYRRVVTLDDSSTTDQLESSECEVRSNSFLSDDRSVEETESSQGSSHNTSEHDSDSDSFVVDDDEYLTDDASFSLASYSEVSSSVTDLSNKEPIRRTQRLRFAKIDLDTGMIDHIDETNSPTTEEPSLVSEHDVATVDNSSDDEGPEEQQNPNSSRKGNEKYIYTTCLRLLDLQSNFLEMSCASPRKIEFTTVNFSTTQIGEEKVESVKASTSSESDEDDDESFERYLKKLRTGSSREERTEVKENIVHEKSFIVSDSDVSASASSSESETADSIWSPSSSDCEDEPRTNNFAFVHLSFGVSCSNHLIEERQLLKSIKDSFNSPSVLPSKGKKPIDQDEHFLISLSPDYSGRRHPDAEIYIKKGIKNEKQRAELASRLFDIFRHQCFKDELPEFLDVKWNPRLRKTAGMCRNKPDRTSWIELSPKVCSAPDRVRDTLIHEMCHAAVWIVDGRVKEGHGPVWKKWAHQCMLRFPSLPVIGRCHDYEIEAKFVYECGGCGQKVGRHTKSLDIVRKICGICKGRFTLQVRQNARKTTTKEGLEHNPFAKFVKENYGKHKKPGVKHGEVMRLLSQLYKEHSTPKTTGVEAELPKELDISVLSIHE